MPQTTAPAAPSSAVVGRDRALVAGVAGAIAFALVGWRALLVPSLLRSIEDAYAQDDAALGAYFLVASAAYAAGTLAGGVMLRRLEARATLGLAGLSMALGLIAQGVVGDWTVFLAAGAPSGFGAGLAEMAINALFLDLFPGSRGRSLNLLHLSFSIAALAAPVVVAQLVAGGTPWQEVMAGSGLAWLVMTAMLVAATPRVTHVPPAGWGA
jgi:fucose permease